MKLELPFMQLYETIRYRTVAQNNQLIEIIDESIDHLTKTMD